MNDEGRLANISVCILKGVANNYIPVVVSKGPRYQISINSVKLFALKPTGRTD